MQAGCEQVPAQGLLDVQCPSGRTGGGSTTSTYCGFESVRVEAGAAHGPGTAIACSETSKSTGAQALTRSSDKRETGASERGVYGIRTLERDSARRGGSTTRAKRIWGATAASRGQWDPRLVVSR